jgi:hypothetical protein
MISQDEAKSRIAQAISVTRADVVAAKSNLAAAGHGVLRTTDLSIEWARHIVPDAPNPVRLYEETLDDQLHSVAKFFSARLAIFAAAWEMVQSGIFIAAGAVPIESFTWGWTTAPPRGTGSAGGFDWKGQITVVYPELLVRVGWYSGDSDLFDADLYLQRLAPAALHPQIEQALRLSLRCFRRDLYVPSIAMLGAASEGAWIEMGEQLADKFRAQPDGAKLAAALRDVQVSTKAKIDRVCHFYERPQCRVLHTASGVDSRRLRAIQQWSDQVRESRNVLHWGAVPSVPNTYEKVAILLMDAVSELVALHAVRDAAK